MMSKAKQFFKRELKETHILLRSIPAIVVTLFTLSVVMMNLAAQKTIVEIGSWFALDGGIMISWLSFMCMDMITKHFGPKAATKISILAICINLMTCFIFWLVSIIPNPSALAADKVLGGTWFILLSSTIAFLISAIINIFTNWMLGKAFKKNPNGKAAYITRTYISTFIGQFLDNLIFAIPVFMIFAPIYWDGFSWTLTQCITCSLTGAFAELIMEIVFSPFGYKICKKWENEKVGKEYLDFIDNRINEVKAINE